MAENPVKNLLDESVELENKGEFGQAINLVQQAVTYLENTHSSDQDKAIALIRLGRLEFRLGHYRRAHKITDEGLKIAHLKSEAAIEGMITNAVVMAETDDLAGAEKELTQVVELCRELGLDKILYRALHDLAVGVYMPRGQFELALTFEREALLLARRGSIKSEVWKLLYNIGWVYWLSGNSFELQEILQELQEEVIPNTPSEGYSLLLRANATLESHHDSSLVLSYLTQARLIGETRGDPGLIAMVRIAFARYYIKMQKPAPALDWAGLAVDYAKKVGYQHMLGFALNIQALALWLAGDLPGAEQTLLESISVNGKIDTRYDLAYAWLQLAIIQYFHGLKGASETWIQAMRLIIKGDYACLIDKTEGFAYQMLNESLSSKNDEEQKLGLTLLNALKRMPAQPLRITTLGDFFVEQGGRRIDSGDLRQRRAGELLALLLSQPHRRIGQEKALEALFPGESVTKQQTILYHATSTLRRLLEPNLPDKFPSRYLDVRNEQIQLILPPGSWVDYDIFMDHCRHKRYDLALGLYGGEWIVEYAYADWAADLRQRLTHLFLEGLDVHTHNLLKHHNPSEALESSRRILALEPWNEVAAFMAMQACYMLGDKVGAIRIYRSLQSALSDEFGLEPSSEIKVKFNEIMAEVPETN